MLSDLGQKRIITLFALIALNGLLAAYIYVHLTPNIIKSDREFRTVRQETGEMKDKLDEIRVQFDVFDKQSENFNNIKEAGFLEKQHRRKIEILLEKIEKTTNVKAKVLIDRANLVEDEDAARSGRFVLESPVQIELNALSDVDVFKYIYLLENYLPGHLTIEDITMNREKNVDGPVLRSIANGDNPVIVTASIKIMWRVMVKEGQEEEAL